MFLAYSAFRFGATALLFRDCECDTARQILRFIAWSVPLYGVPSQTPEVTFSGGSSELPQTPFPVAGSIYGPSAMLRFLHPKRYQVLVDAPPASECRSEELSSSTSGDHEGLHPTSVRFRRYPLRGTVLATSLARWGDSVTGVNANYHLTNTLSTPSFKPVFQRLKLDYISIQRVFPEVIHRDSSHVYQF